MNRSFIVTFLLVVGVGLAHANTTQEDESVDLNALYQQIDEAILQSPQFVAEREHKITACRNRLMRETSEEKKVSIAEELFLLYQPYKNDSALHYAEVCINLADSLHRPDLVGRFRSLLAYQCSNSDMYTESLEQLRMVDRSALDKNGQCDYYYAWMHVCGEIGSYTQVKDVRERYFDQQNLYRDSVLMVADEGSEHDLHLKMDILNARQLYQDALKISDEWFKMVTNKTHESAYAAFYRSMVYEKLGNHDMVCYWLGRSALDDISCAVMNQASLLFLAEHLADDGDISRARRYVEFAKDCNYFFCPRLHNYQVNSVLKVIEKSNQATQSRANLMLIIASVVIVLLLLVLIFTVFRLRRRLLLIMLMPLSTAAVQSQDFCFNEVAYTPEATTFRLFAPNDAKKVVVRIYNQGLDGKAVKTVKMSRNGNEQWSATVKGDLMGKFYTFDIGKGECPGVFAKAVGVNGKRGAIINMDNTNPQGWGSDSRPVMKSPADLVVYEMHHRDFSIAREDAKYKGKFLALTEPWAINHLKELGVNAIHILPSYDYGSVDETRLADNKYNWGYDPVNYNVPEGGYSTNPYEPVVRIREFKAMVQALHKVGIRVILDVVYNHTYDIEHSNFQRTYPDYYYRTLPPKLGGDRGLNKEYSNGSGCGNETASDQPMMRKFMIESVKYWINEYHIDGFRFDLMGCHDIETMNAIRKAVDEIDPSIFIYGEGWSAGGCGLPNEQLGMKANIPQMPRIAAFSDEIRDALRGPFDDDSKCGWLGTGIRIFKSSDLAGFAESLKFGIAGAIAHPQVDMSKVNYSKEPWANEPTQMMSYVSCHDDMCLFDRLKASLPGVSRDELIRLDLLAQTAVFTSQGVPFMLSGEELLRTKLGVHNSFESPDSINHLDWGNKTKYPQVFTYYKNLIALRQHHPAFRLGNADLVRKHLEFLKTPDKVVAYRLKYYAGRDDWRNIIVILNANRADTEVTIPEGNYTIVCCDGVINENGLGTLKGSKAIVDAQSALILHD